MSSSIKAGAAISYASIILNIMVSLVYTPWMINTIGKSDYGIYSLVMSFLSYFLLDFGLGSAISRFIAKYRAVGDKEGINRMFSVTTLVYLCLDIIIFVTLAVLYFFVSDIFVKLTPSEMETFKTAYIIAAFFSVSNFFFNPFTGAMMAFEFFVPLKLLDMAQRLGTVGLITIALFFGGDIYALVLVNGCVALSISIYKFVFVKRNADIVIKIKLFDKKIAKSLFNFSFWIFLINIAQRLRLNLIPFVLGIYSGTAEIALFAVGMNLEGFIYVFSSALNGLFIPKVSRMVQENSDDRSEISQLMTKVGRIQLYIVGYIIIGLFGFGKSFIDLWIGNDYSDTYYVMVFLISLNIISMTQAIGTTLSYVKNEVRYNSIIAISASILSFVLSILLAPRYGAIGCGCAFFISMVLSSLLSNIFFKKILKLNVMEFFKNCHFKICHIQFFILVLMLICDNYIGIGSWLNLIFAGGIYTIVYAVACYYLCLNAKEKTMVYEIVNKLKKKI